MRDTEKVTETTSIGALADTGTSKKDPLNVAILGIFPGKIVAKSERRRGSG